MTSYITILDPRIVGFRRNHCFLYGQVMVKLKAPRVGKSSRRVVICLLIAGFVVSPCLYNTPPPTFQIPEFWMLLSVH